MIYNIFKKCVNCNGKGRFLIEDELGMGTFYVNCSVCTGVGTILKEEYEKPYSNFRNNKGEIEGIYKSHYYTIKKRKKKTYLIEVRTPGGGLYESRTSQLKEEEQAIELARDLVDSIINF